MYWSSKFENYFLTTINRTCFNKTYHFKSRTLGFLSLPIQVLYLTRVWKHKCERGYTYAIDECKSCRRVESENGKIATLQSSIHMKVFATDLEWKTIERIKYVQYVAEITKDLTLDVDGLLRKENAIWIPKNSVEFKISWPPISHFRMGNWRSSWSGGHYKFDLGNISVVLNHKWCVSVCSGIYSRLVSRSDERVSRPPGTTLHG